MSRVLAIAVVPARGASIGGGSRPRGEGRLHQSRQVPDHPGGQLRPAAARPLASCSTSRSLAKMEERTQAIRKSLEEAQAARAEAQREREAHAAKIQAAHAEAQAIRAAALKEAADEQRRLVEAARGEAARLVESAKAELAQDVRRARQDLRREVSDLADPRWRSGSSGRACATRTIAASSKTRSRACTRCARRARARGDGPSGTPRRCSRWRARRGPRPPRERSWKRSSTSW